MRLPVRVTTRRLLVLVALIAAGFGVWDRVQQNQRAARFRRSAAHYDRQVAKCRAIIALPPAECARLNDYWMDDPLYSDQAWTGRMIPYFTAMRDRCRYAADHPRDPLPPLPPTPQ